MSLKSKIGRPRLPMGSAREGRLYCRILESEIAEIGIAAREAGKTKSVWIREVLLAAARTTPEPEADPPTQCVSGRETP